MIDVEESERYVHLVAPRVGQLRTQLRVEVLAVVGAGQRVGHARVVQLLEQRLLTLVGDRVAEDRGGAELNHVTIAQQLARYALTLHERAVGRLRVFDQVGRALLEDARVLAADAVVTEPQFAVLAAADAERLGRQARHTTELSAFHPHEQVPILRLPARDAA